MALKKSVCKKCRIKELGRTGWNEFVEAWFDPVYNGKQKYRSGTTTCPRSIFDCLRDSIKKKVLSSATPLEKIAITEGIICISNVEGDWTISSEGKPPVWCPYRKEHIEYSSPPERRKRNKSIW